MSVPARNGGRAECAAESCGQGAVRNHEHRKLADLNVG